MAVRVSWDSVSCCFDHLLKTVTHTHTHAHTSTYNHVLQRFDRSFESLVTQNVGEIIRFGKSFIQKEEN